MTLDRLQEKSYKHEFLLKQFGWIVKYVKILSVRAEHIINIVEHETTFTFLGSGIYLIYSRARQLLVIDIKLSLIGY